MIQTDRFRLPLKFSYNHYAILYRTNAQSRTLEEILLHHGLPYRLVGGTKFYERKEIKDCLAYLRLLANSKDAVSRKRLDKIGKRRLASFLEWQETLPAQLPVTTELLDSVLRVTNYLDLFDTKNEQDLASVATEFPVLSDFLENVSLVQQDYLPDKNPGENNHEAITLMTLHAAKGLEFPTVFLTGMEEGLFPHSRSLLSKDELEEERRLCYVGITRARKRLYLTWALRRLRAGGFIDSMPSRFLREMPPELLYFE